MKMKLKDKITNFLETGTSSWTDEPVIRAPTKGNPVFLELLEQHKKPRRKNGDTFG